MEYIEQTSYPARQRSAMPEANDVKCEGSFNVSWVWLLSRYSTFLYIPVKSDGFFSLVINQINLEVR